jgi:Flp pilus assembly protein CpaB
MSDNHRHEPQDERLERSIRDRQPTGNRLLDDLVGTVPRANPDFQQSLEDRLLTSLKRKERNTEMIATDRYPDTKKVRRFSIPLTLAAAMLAVVIAGGVLLNVNRTNSNTGVAAQSEASATVVPTASPTFIPTLVGNQPALANSSTLPGILPGIVVPAQGTQAAIYAGPGEDYVVIDQLDAGTQVNVLGRTEDSVWLRIQTLSGRDGWITSNQVELPSIPVLDLTVTATPIPDNVVTLPPTLVSRQELISLLIPIDGTVIGEADVYTSLNNLSTVIAQISPGTAVQITGTTGVFVDDGEERALLQIRLEDGTEGWIDAHLVEVQLPPTPVIEAMQVTPTATIVGWELTPVPSPDVIPNAVATVRPNDVSPAPSVEITLLPVTDLQPIVIALHDLPAQTPITAEDLAVVYWPAYIVPDGTYSDIETLLGASANVLPQRTIAQWQPLLATDLMFALGDILPSGTVALSVPLEPSQAAMSWVQEGSTVDIYAAMLFVDIDDQFQMLDGTPAPANFPTPVPGEAPRLVTQRVIDDAQVIQVGSINEPNAAPDVVVLAVSPQDATVLTWMVESRLPIIFLPHNGEPLNVEFGSELTLLGYTTDHQKGSFEFTLYWYAYEQPTADYSLSVSVVNETREIVLQHDVALLNAVGSPTSQWVQNAIVAYESTLDFAEAPGDYTVSIALFSASDGVRLPITSPIASEDTQIEDNLLLLYNFTQE